MLGGGSTYVGRLDRQIAPVDDVSVGDVVGDTVILASPRGLQERGGFLEALENSWADAVAGRGRRARRGRDRSRKDGVGTRVLRAPAAPAADVVRQCDGLRTRRPLAQFADIAASASDGFAETIARGERSTWPITRIWPRTGRRCCDGRPQTAHEAARGDSHREASAQMLRSPRSWWTPRRPSIITSRRSCASSKFACTV